MAQRGRCPGGRPSVSANKRIRCRLFCSKVATVQASYEHRIRSAVSQRVPLICIGESNSIQQLNNNCGDNPKIVSVGRRLSGSLEQGLVMAPPRARMTNDRSTGVAVRFKLAGIGTGKTVRKQTVRRGI